MTKIPICPIHGNSPHTTYTNNVHGGKYQYQRTRCNLCVAKERQSTRLGIKQQLIAEFGGKCSRCGYDKSIWALEFHHRDPKEKDAKLRMFSSYKKAKIEANKCDLVCANCHREIHHELWVRTHS